MSVLYGGFLGRISMGEYPYSIWRFRRLPTGDPSVIMGNCCGVGVYWGQFSCRGGTLYGDGLQLGKEYCDNRSLMEMGVLLERDL